MERIYDIYGTSNLLLFKEENILNYRPGGYHPVALGDTLNGRYQIHHKLGHGGFSTVWVAKDNKYVASSIPRLIPPMLTPCGLEQWVAIKILTAERTMLSRELYNLRALAEHAEGDLGLKNIVQLLDDFLLEGPNGCHQCLVLEMLGPTVNVIVNDYHGAAERLDTESILKISTQLLQAVAFMHAAGYAHGDLSIRNLAFNSSSLSHLSEEDLFKVIGFPESEEVTRVDGESLGDGIPRCLIRSADWAGWPHEDDEEDEDIRVIDLGEAFTQNTKPERLAQPGGLQAPETIFTGEFDWRIDLWRAGLIVRFPLAYATDNAEQDTPQIYYLTFGTLPFHWFRMDSLVASMIDFAGELPREWRTKWEQLRLDAGREFGIREKAQLLESKLDRNFRENVHDPELKALLPVIKGLTRFLPSDRISASQALDLIKSHGSDEI